MAIPVADHESAEIHAALEHVGQHDLVAVHLFAVEAVERGHHALCASGNRRRITGGVDIAHGSFGHLGVALVLAVGGAAVADEMLHRRNDVAAVQELRRARHALYAFDHLAGKAGHHVRRLGIAFVGPAPAVVLRHGHGRREGPLHAGDAGFGSGDFADLLDQVRVARCAQADVVRKQRGTDDVALAVHRIDAEDDRNRVAALGGVHRRLIERVGQLQPFGRAGVVLAARIGIAAGQHRADTVLAHVVRGHAGDIALDGLGNLLFHAHLGHHIGDALLQRRVLREWPLRRRPLVRMDGGRRLGRCGGRSRLARLGSSVLALAGGQHQHRRSGGQAEGATRDGRGGTTEQLVQDSFLQGGSPTAMRCAAGH